MAKSLKNILDTQQLVGQFHFKHYPSAKFGEIYRPEIAVEWWSEKYQEWQRVSMLVDTGADYCILPRYLAVLMGLDLSQVKATETTGVGGAQKVYFVPELRLRVGTAERVVPVGFIDSNQVPPLLGRHAALETFTCILDKRARMYFGE